MARKPKKNVSVLTFQKTLKHQLTDEDNRQYLKKFLALTRDMAEIVADRKSSNEMYKDRFAKRESERQRIITALDMGTEDREVTVEKEINWKTRKVTIRRMDTKKVIERSGLLPEESQMELKGEAEAAAEAEDTVQSSPEQSETSAPSDETSVPSEADWPDDDLEQNIASNPLDDEPGTVPTRRGRKSAA